MHGVMIWNIDLAMSFRSRSE